MTSTMLVPSTAHHRRFPDSIFKQPRHLRTRDCSRASREVSCRLAPSHMRGMERREAQMSCFASGIACEAMVCPKAHRLTALHLRRFWARGACFRMGRANPDPAIFIAFISIPCSRERQSHVVGPDAGPSLPDACVRNTRAGAASLLRFKAPSRSAPHEQDNKEYIPISQNVNMSCHSARGERSRRPSKLASSRRWLLAEDLLNQDAIAPEHWKLAPHAGFER
jgi:hypothetical protein